MPRVWEKIEEKMKAAGAQVTGLKKKLATWAKRVGFEGSMAKQTGGKVPGGFGLANKYTSFVHLEPNENQIGFQKS